MTARPTLLTPAAPADTSESAPSWRTLTAQVGREIAEPLSAALERVIALTTTGRIDREGLRLLRLEIEQARRVGMVSQQLTRLGSKHPRQSHERLNLAHTLQSVLAYRARELAKRGINVRQVTRPIEVLVDPSLLFTLLNAMLDWAVESGRASVDFRVDLKSWPVQGRVSCSFECNPVGEEPPDAAGHAALDSLNWHLVVQAAQALGLSLRRDVQEQRVMLTVEFPRTVEDAPQQPAPLPDPAGPLDVHSVNSKPLAGRHLLVIADARELRKQVREAVSAMGLTVDCVYSVDEAVDFCREGLPHAIVFEGALRNDRLDQLAEDIRAELPEFSFLEIVEEGRSFEVSGFDGMSPARVGRAALRQALPSALVFELSKNA